MKSIIIKVVSAYVLFITLQWFTLNLISTLGGTLIALFIDRDATDSVETAITALGIYTSASYYLFSFVAFYIAIHVFFLRNNNLTSHSSGTTEKQVAP